MTNYRIFKFSYFFGIFFSEKSFRIPLKSSIYSEFRNLKVLSLNCFVFYFLVYLNNVPINWLRDYIQFKPRFNKVQKSESLIYIKWVQVVNEVAFCILIESLTSYNSERCIIIYLSFMLHKKLILFIFCRLIINAFIWSWSKEFPIGTQRSVLVKRIKCNISYELR